MLEMRPCCEHCGINLPAGEGGARICSYECTFCEKCAAHVLGQVCPNCTGALVPRPPRSADQLELAPPSNERVLRQADLAVHEDKQRVRRTAVGTPHHVWEVVIDTLDPQRSAGFWAQILDAEPHHASSDWSYVEPLVRGPDTMIQRHHTLGGMRIGFQRVADPTPGKTKVHLDIGSWDLSASVALAVQLGATVLEERSDDHGAFVVMRDPDGIEFCFVDAD